MHNFGLFDRYLNKVKAATIDKFGSLSGLQAFLHHLAEQGNVLLALKKQDFPKLSPLELAKLIKQDKYLAKCIDLAESYAAELVEAVLYDRAINGYEELTFDKEGRCVTRKRKYCSKSLLEYLKANSVKYQPKNDKIAGFGIKQGKNKERGKESSDMALSFEVESYASDTDQAETDQAAKF